MGAAYVFEYGDDPATPSDPSIVWYETAKLADPDGSTSDQFASSVGLSGTILVGSIFGEGGRTVANSGSAIVFTLSGGTWSIEEQFIAGYLAPTDLIANNRFGRSVAVDGETAVVGIPSRNFPDSVNAGSAMVFERQTGGVWSLVGNSGRAPTTPRTFLVNQWPLMATPSSLCTVL